MNIPNKITIVRACMVPVFVVVMLLSQIPYNKEIAGVIFILACTTDFVDGYLARKWNLTTNFGKFMDPLADKLLVCSALILFVHFNLIPSWIVIVIIGRDFIINGYRQIAADRGIVIAANYWGKVKTVVQMLMSILLIFKFDGFDVIEQIFIYASLALTVISLIDYVWKNRQVLHD